MTRSDILILALHAVFLGIWFLDSKAMDWYRMHFKYRKAIKNARYTHKDLKDYVRIHESAHSQSLAEDMWSFGFEQKTKNQKSFDEEKSRRNHPTSWGREYRGAPEAGMFNEQPGTRRKGRRNPRKQGFYITVDQLLFSEERRRRKD